MWFNGAPMLLDFRPKPKPFNGLAKDAVVAREEKLSYCASAMQRKTGRYTRSDSRSTLKRLLK
jgi:hypothetical protein